MQRDEQDQPIMDGATEATGQEKRDGAAEQADADRIKYGQDEQEDPASEETGS